jgi:hypothetical protein
MSFKRIELNKLKQSHCVSFETIERQNFKKEFLKEGYKPRKGVITVGFDNKILNGNNRFCLLLQKFGGDYKIIVKKKFITFNILRIIAVIMLPIIFIKHMFINYNEDDPKRNGLLNHRIIKKRNKK